jgi:hypothetical protein
MHHRPTESYLIVCQGYYNVTDKSTYVQLSQVYRRLVKLTSWPTTNNTTDTRDQLVYNRDCRRDYAAKYRGKPCHHLVTKRSENKDTTQFSLLNWEWGGSKHNFRINKRAHSVTIRVMQ